MGLLTVLSKASSIFTRSTETIDASREIVQAVAGLTHDAVVGAEQTFGPGQGDLKMGLASEVLNASVPLIQVMLTRQMARILPEASSADMTEVAAALRLISEGVVRLLNAIRVFKRSGPQPR